MPKVEVEQEIKGSPEKVYAAVKAYLDGRDTLKKLGAEIEWQDKAKSAQITGGAFAGKISVVAEGKASLVTITIDLPLLMTPFKGKVQEELAKHLARVKA